MVGVVFFFVPNIEGQGPLFDQCINVGWCNTFDLRHGVIGEGLEFFGIGHARGSLI
jgi:hypothetical protein